MPSSNQTAPSPTAPTLAPADVERAVAAFDALQHRMMAIHAPEFTTLDLTMAQAKLLYVLAVGGELSLSETASRLHVSASTASGAVDHLVARGLVARREDESDRRQLRISLTAAGVEALEQLRELGSRPLRALFLTLDPARLAVVEDAIRILDDAVGVAWPAAGDPPADQRSSRS